ncbi:uroporphyrinogen decarboxylase family protein [Fontivita pretiosa]|uniref:uroporphyrinogen decarboxylase family protein n=1 Tax=Fontivita pretiosa TaxID=2989684 RepID=UPI003D16AD92
MTHRQRFRAALRGQPIDHWPAVCRLDLWYRARQLDGRWPASVAGKSLQQLQLDLGMGLSSRAATVYQLRYRPPVRYDRTVAGDELRERWETPAGSLQRISKWAAGEAALGMAPHIVQYPIRTRDDYRIFHRIVQSLEFIPQYDAFAAYDRAVGENGLPMVILGPDPAHWIMLCWTGYEGAYYQIADDPTVFEEAVDAAQQAYRAMWPIVADSACELVMHGVNYDSAATPPDIFRRYFLPYLEQFNRTMHGSGKWTALHADGDMSRLLDLAVEAGFDVADCFACAPLVRCRFEDALRAWRGHIAIWGGIPSPLLEPTTSDAAFDEHLDYLARQLTPADRFIASISDQAMPDAIYERIARIAFRLCRPPVAQFPDAAAAKT